MSNFYRESLLDDDIERLRRWYKTKFGKEFCIGDNTTDIYVGVKRDTDYPLPDSYQESSRKPKKPKVDPEAYSRRVRQLERDGHVSLREAAAIVGVSKNALKNDVNEGFIAHIMIEAPSRRDAAIFVLRTELDRYIAWRNAGRQRAGKWQTKSKKDKAS